MSGSTVSSGPARAYRRRLLRPIGRRAVARREQADVVARAPARSRRARAAGAPPRPPPSRRDPRRRARSAAPRRSARRGRRARRGSRPCRAARRPPRPAASARAATSSIVVEPERLARRPPGRAPARVEGQRRVMAGQRPGERRVRRAVDDAGRRDVVHGRAGAVDQRRVGQLQQPRGVVLERARRSRATSARTPLAAPPSRPCRRRRRPPAPCSRAAPRRPGRSPRRRRPAPARSGRRGRAPAAARSPTGRSASRVASSSSSSRVITTWRANSSRDEHARDREPDPAHERRDQHRVRLDVDRRVQLLGDVEAERRRERHRRPPRGSRTTAPPAPPAARAGT